MDAKLQAAILHDINAVIGVAGSEESLPLVQLHQHHVATELQEERLLKVAQHPECKHHSLWVNITVSFTISQMFHSELLIKVFMNGSISRLEWGPNHGLLH